MPETQQTAHTVFPRPAAAAQTPASVFGFFAFITIIIASTFMAWLAWSYYVLSPWTRDATVRAYTAQVAPEVSGRITSLLVADNQNVKRGDVLFKIDDRNYRFALARAEANVDKTHAEMTNRAAEIARRRKLSDLAVTDEELQTYDANAQIAASDYQTALADVNNARLNLERTEVRSPVNGVVTNLVLQAGSYATAGQAAITVIDAESYWLAGYFEETQLRRIGIGKKVAAQLMGYPGMIVEGHVESIARGIVDPNAQPGTQGFATVNPVFTWVRLAQRIPVRIHIDHVPSDVALAAGMTATVQVLDQHR